MNPFDLNIRVTINNMDKMEQLVERLATQHAELQATAREIQELELQISTEKR